MGTYRRFCCNDLLRFGRLNLNSETPTHPVNVYFYHMALWPGNCLVAVSPGGRLMGYVFGDVEGIGQNRTGQLSMMALPSTQELDFGKKLSKLLEDSCDKIYGAYSMKIIIPANNFPSKYILEKLGYKIFKRSSKSLDMKKALPRLIAMIPGEETQKESIKPPT